MQIWSRQKQQRPMKLDGLLRDYVNIDRFFRTPSVCVDVFFLFLTIICTLQNVKHISHFYRKLIRFLRGVRLDTLNLLRI